MTTPRSWRFDRIRIRFDQRSFAVDAKTGYVTVWGTVVSGNQFLTYGRADGAPQDDWIEFVPESTVFDESSMRTMLNRPITFHHPPEMLDATNTSRFQVGSIVGIQRRADEFRAQHQFTDERVIQAARSGIVELSPGYTAEIIKEAGSFDGRDYHARQDGREYNHNALVPEARAGHSNALDKMDAMLRGIFRTDDLRISNQQDRTDTMKTITIDGKDFEVADEVADAFASRDSEDTDTNDAEGDDDESGAGSGGESGEGGDDPPADEETEDDKRGDAAQPLTTASLIAFGAQLRADVAGDVTKRLDARDERQRKDALARGEVVAKAKGLLPESYKFDGKPLTRIMYDAIVEVKPSAKKDAQAAKKDAGVLRGMFNMLDAETREDSTPLGGTGSGAPADNVCSIEKARKDAIARTDAAQATGKVGRAAFAPAGKTAEKGE